MTSTIEVIDSHTGGEPTRVVIAGGPDLGGGDMAARRERLRTEHDQFRSAMINEPRGWDAVVGALLCETLDADCATGVIFFNNVGMIGMCVHGMIGVVKTLAHLQRIAPGMHRIETPVGEVQATLHDDGQVSIRNVPSYRFAKDVAIEVEGYGEAIGDIAWGGNWFFKVTSWGGSPDPPELSIANIEKLTHCTKSIRRALEKQNITGENGGVIDHIELYGAPTTPNADSKNFVLCPGGAYDRSPCGTGTSAKVACLHADGKLAPGEIWRQESIIGSIFRAKVEVDPTDPTRVIPTIQGSAFITAEAKLIIDPADPFRDGIVAGRTWKSALRRQ